MDNNTPLEEKITLKICVNGSDGIDTMFLHATTPLIKEQLNDPNIGGNADKTHISAQLSTTTYPILNNIWLLVNVYKHTRFERIPHRILYYNTLVTYIAFDLCDPEPLRHIQQWLEEVDRYAHEDMVIVVVGLKTNNDVTVTEQMLNNLIEANYSINVIHSYFTSLHDEDRYSKFEHSLYIALQARCQQNLYTLPSSSNQIPLSFIKSNYKKRQEELIQREKNINNNNNNNQNNVMVNSRDNLFKMIIRSKIIMMEIWRQVKVIHKDMGIRVGQLKYNFLADNGYTSALLWIFKNGEKLDVNLYTNISLCPQSFFELLRSTDNMGLFTYIYGHIEESLRSPPEPIVKNTAYAEPFIKSKYFKSTIMDECIIGGSAEVIQFLGSKGYRPSVRGLRLSILFGDVEMVSYIIEKVLKKSTTMKNKSTTLLLQQQHQEQKENEFRISQRLKALPPTYIQDLYSKYHTPGHPILHRLKYYTSAEHNELLMMAKLYGKVEIEKYLKKIVFIHLIPQTIINLFKKNK